MCEAVCKIGEVVRTGEIEAAINCEGYHSEKPPRMATDILKDI